MPRLFLYSFQLKILHLLHVVSINVRPKKQTMKLLTPFLLYSLMAYLSYIQLHSGLPPSILDCKVSIKGTCYIITKIGHL
jgi:hypothetical protein